MNRRWLLVAGDLSPLGGMDRANHALAAYLATHDRDVHVVTHRAWGDVAALPGVTVHRVWRPFNRHLLGSPLLAREGSRVWRDLTARDGRPLHAVANGGNCRIGAANWIHYLHAAYDAPPAGSLARHAKAHVARRRDLAAERDALARARLVICNSRRTLTDVVERIGVPESRTRLVYYGTDPVRFAPVEAAARESAKRAIGRPADRPVVGFVGALGDRRKAFDSVFAAWTSLCADPGWDADLVVVGAGAELPLWTARAEAAGLARRVAFLGFRHDVPQLLAAFDGLVHPARYEAYGLSVHEAICCGVPALVSRRAGVAERYPPALGDLLVDDPEDGGELAGRLRLWRQGLERYRAATVRLSSSLRSRTWDDMAREIADHVELAA